MAIGKYAVWTSEVNVNDKPDLNEAFSSSENAAQMTRWRAQADALWGQTSGQRPCPVLCTCPGLYGYRECSGSSDANVCYST
jgi:hypothetical protein